MHFETSIYIDAPPERVWPVIHDVERWHEWTASITSIELLDGGPLAVGSRARVRQPKLPTTVWTVTTVEPGRSFTWEVRNAVSSTVANHRVEPDGDGGRATLTIDQGGLMTPLFWFYRSLTRRYLEMEINGLKARVEAS